MEKSNKVATGALLLLIYILLLFGSLLIPFLLVFSLFILPLPFILFARRFGWQTGAIFLGFALVASSIISLSVGLLITLFVGVGGIVIGNAIKQKKHPYEALANGTAGYIIGLLLVVLTSHYILDVNLISGMENMLDESYETSQDVIQGFSSESLTDDQLKANKEQMNSVKELIPSIVVFISVVFAWITQWLSYKWLTRAEKRRFAFPPFSKLRIPIGMIFIYLLAMVVSFAVDADSTAGFAVENVMAVIGLLIVIHGLSFIFFYVESRKWTLPKPLLGIILVVLLPLILPIVRILGIIDLGFNLRDRMSPKE